MSQPSWLNEDNAAVAGAVASNPAARAFAKDMDPEDYKNMKKHSFYLATAYILCAALMATAAALSLNNTSTTTAFIALYVFSFSIMIFCFDFAPCMGFSGMSRIIANNFGFMYSGIGRVVFLIFVAVLNFHLKLFGQIAMGLLLAATVLHIYIIYLFPPFSAFLRRSHLQGVKSFE